MIALDVHSSSALQFGVERRKALEEIGGGKKVIWHFDFGFFDRLLFPLFEPMQTGAHKHAIDHFMKSLWVEFSEYTESLSLYRGPLSTPVPFDDFGSYMNLLADFFKEELPLAIDFEEEEITPVQLALKTTPEDWGRFAMTLRQHPLPHRSVKEPIAILLPPKEEITPPIIESLERIAQKLFPLRFVYEAFLTSEWEGVNELYVVEKSLRPATRRKLAGFQAADGIVHIIS